jgi:dihydroxy-acid dehydratase
VIHLIAIARRLGIDLTLDRFDRLSRETPYLCATKPSGPYMMEHLFEAGGIPAVMGELKPLLHLNALTVTGQTIGENLARARVLDRRVIASLEQPLHPQGGIAILRGSLAPHGAVIKQSAASPHLLRHRGRALVFNSSAEIQRRIVQERLEADEDTVFVMRYQGPLGAPGMPETGGSMPIPENLLKRGIRDVLRITDARMSGTAFGSIVLHVEPEAAASGPLAAVEDGDEIEIDVPARRLDLLVDEREVQRRLAAWRPPERPWTRGYRALFLDHVLQASQGCDFDFLARLDPETYRPPRPRS